MMIRAQLLLNVFFVFGSLVLMEGVNLESITNVKGLEIVHVNTRSVFYKLDELKLRFKHFDSIVFTETWLKRSVDDEQLRWDNFQLVRMDRSRIDNKSGAGICIYVRSSIDYEIIQDFQELVCNHIEFPYIKVKPYMQKTINLIGIYIDHRMATCGVYTDYLRDLESNR